MQKNSTSLSLATGDIENGWKWALGGAVAGALAGLGSETDLGNLFGAAKTASRGIAGSAMDMTIQLFQEPSTQILVSSNPAADGTRDAIINALLLGVPDLYNAFTGHDPSSVYTGESDRNTYILSRTAADAAIATIAINVSNGAEAASGAAQLVAMGGSGTVIIGVGAGTAAGITKILALYGNLLRGLL